MKTVIRRIARLENWIWSAGQSRERFRIIVSRRDVGRCLDGGTCKRTLCSNGMLMEVVRLDKCDAGNEDVTDEQLDAWVDSFPIAR
jgi:hypothetical protein